jgi:hypothetical protein
MAVKKADVKKIVRENYGAIARERPVTGPATGSSC